MLDLKNTTPEMMGETFGWGSKTVGPFKAFKATQRSPGLKVFHF